jgi:hypothetical protein
VTQTPSLREFQDAFARALTDVDMVADATLVGLTRQMGFAVYRNTVMKGCVDALQANFPAVVRLVGESWFRAAAAQFAAAHLPRSPALVDYDPRFPAFLDALVSSAGPSAALPYLADVARLDRHWTEAHISVDARPIAAETVAEYGIDRLADVTLCPHPSARWGWFATMPIYSIWRCNREASAAERLSDIAWNGEGCLIVRPAQSVVWVEVNEAECRFLDACGRGEPLGEAGSAALAVDAGVDLAGLLERLLRIGAFGSLDLVKSEEWTT